MCAFPIMGKAIRKGIPYEVIKLTVDDLFEDGARMYSYQDSTNLDNESRKDFLSACTDFKKNEARRNDEEAKICALITSSFSEEAKCCYGSMRPMSLLLTTTIPSQCIPLPKLPTLE